jgi:hypothetical protein
MEVSGRYARTRAITRDTVSPGNQAIPDSPDASRDVARVVCAVSVLCPPVVAGSDTAFAMTARLRTLGASATARGAGPPGAGADVSGCEAEAKCQRTAGAGPVLADERLSAPAEKAAEDERDNHDVVELVGDRD